MSQPPSRSTITGMKTAPASCRVTVPTVPPAIPLPTTPPFDLVVLPREISDDGIGLYDDSVVYLVKQLRAESVNAGYLHHTAERQWISEKGFADNALSFVLGVASNGAWYGLTLLLRRNHAQSPVRGKVARCVQSSDGTTTWEWYEVEGNGDEVATIIDNLQNKPRTRELPS